MKATRLKRFSGVIGTTVILEKSAMRTLFVTSLVIATIIVVEGCRVVETSSNGSLQWLTDNGGPLKPPWRGTRLSLSRSAHPREVERETATKNGLEGERFGNAIVAEAFTD